MKKIFAILFIFLALHLRSQTGAIDPTGSYFMDHTTKDTATEDVWGYSGSIDVKKFRDKWIIMSFFICKGAPSYNIGVFVDTMEFSKNTAIHSDDTDLRCRITFLFSQKGVTVKEKTKNFNCGCGFGHAVLAHGFFERITCCEPEIRWDGTGERIENKTALKLLRYSAIFTTCRFSELSRKRI